MLFIKSPAIKLALSGTVVAAVSILPLLLEVRGVSITLRHIGDWLGWLGAGMLTGSLLLMVRAPPWSARVRPPRQGTSKSLISARVTSDETSIGDNKSRH